MAIRKIVKIDEIKCNGCGLCIPNCAEGALAIVEGKAKLIKDIYCDGLGACLGHCPMDAIEVIEREAAEFDEEAVEEMLKVKENEKKMDLVVDCGCGGNHGHKPVQKIKVPNPMMSVGGGCPGSRMRTFNKNEDDKDDNVKVTSKLRQWPVQLMLVPVNAPYFEKADLLVTADCVPFAYANYHNEFLKGKAVVVGCPKQDNNQNYTNKLTGIISENNLKSITVLRMEVPCCSGIENSTRIARDNSAADIRIKVVTISLEGEIIDTEYV